MPPQVCFSRAMDTFSKISSSRPSETLEAIDTDVLLSADLLARDCKLLETDDMGEIAFLPNVIVVFLNTNNIVIKLNYNHIKSYQK